MNGSLRQRSPGSWELTVDLGRDLRRAAAQVPHRPQYEGPDAAQAPRDAVRPRQGVGLTGGRVLLRDWLDRWMRAVVIPHRRPNARQRDSTYQTGQRCSDKRDHLLAPNRYTVRCRVIKPVGAGC